MPTKRTLKAQQTRHPAALEYARAFALSEANKAAKTSHAATYDGRLDPTFCRVYVESFAAAYAEKIREPR